MNFIHEKAINGSHLKIIAIFAMLIDHIGFFILDFLPDMHCVFLTIMGLDFSPYSITRFIGRCAFPLFSFLLVEGFIHTHNRRKYGQNLLLFALLSEIPWNLVHTNQFLYEKQNVFFTLLIGYLALCAIERYHSQQTKLGLTITIILILSHFTYSDYGYIGALFICSIYVLRSNPMLMTSVGIFLLPSKWIGGLSFIPISLYNGQRGFIKGNFAKYAFYMFYPMHLFILYTIKVYIFC